MTLGVDINLLENPQKVITIKIIIFGKLEFTNIKTSAHQIYVIKKLDKPQTDRRYSYMFLRDFCQEIFFKTATI